MENEEIVTIDMLNDEELVNLYCQVLEHIEFLNNSILELESEGNDNE